MPALLHRLLFVQLLLLGTLSAAAPVLDAREQALVAAIDREQERALALLEQSVNINSGTMNFAGVREVGKVFSAELGELGFDVAWEDGQSFGRAGHVVAKRQGNGPKVLLIGHLDTVFPVDSPFQRYDAVDRDTAAGPGVTDMKGGNVVMIQALRALREAGLLDELSFVVVLTGDEESSGEPLALARRSLLDAAEWADIAIGFEDGDSNPETAVVARRGSVDWELTVTGKPAHSSQVFQPEVGYGAIYEAARILDSFRKQLSKYETLTVNPGIVGGGTAVTYEAGAGGTATGKSNIVAETVRVSGDLRTIAPQQLADARAEMERIVADNLAHTSATIVFGEGYPPMAATAGNLDLLAMFDQASRDLGFGAVDAVNPRNAGAADISFTAEYVDMAIDGVGLMGSGGHTVDELADLRTLPMQAKRVAILLYRLSKPTTPGD